MFRDCSALTSLNLGSLWDTASGYSFFSMFLENLMDVDISGFDISLLITAENMMKDSGFSDANYDKMLVAWEAKDHLSDVKFHAGTAKYSSGPPATAREALVSDGWEITDGGPI